MASVADELNALLRAVLSEGAYGFTLRTGELPIVHSPKGRRSIEGIYPTHEDVTTFLRLLVQSREMRHFREQGVVHFTQTFEGHVRLLGAVRKEKDEIHVEVRRMAA